MKWLFVLLLLPLSASAKTVHYELTATQAPVNLSGKETVDFALLVNGQLPAPTLEFTEGDTAEIVVRNEIPGQEVSVHWHGILLPPDQDGVPYLNTPPIFTGQSYTFRFPIRQHGTYWYHSHTMVQEQKGVYGAIVIHPRKEEIKADKDAVVVLSDWSDENADQILRNLRKDGDYYQYKKDSVRSYWGAVRAGGLGDMLKNEWERMPGMDLSDVGYDAFLINGKKDSQLLMAHPGEKVRIRVINAAASTYFYVSLGQSPFQVISADGNDIKPVWTNEILMGMAETYDILFTVPEHKNYELRASAQDGTGSASGWIGMGEKVAAPVRLRPDPYAGMDHSSMGHDSMSHDSMNHASMDQGSMNHETMNHGSGHAGMDHSMHHGQPTAAETPANVVPTLTVESIRAKSPTTLPKNAPVHDVKLVLGGDMGRYVWHINGKAIHEDRTLEIKEGELVRYTFVNDTMMHHPMHLHGHFFRVVTEQGDFSPLKHTVDVPPHGTRVIEFYANEPGEWMLHCHNLYHMKNGMARVVKYSSFIPKPEIAMHQKHDPHLHDHFYWQGSLEAATNSGRANLRLSKTWDTLDLDVETREEDRSWEVEGDLFYRRWFGQYFHLIGGGTSFRDHQRAALGAGYTLPFLLETTLLLDSKGDLRLDLERKFQWTKNIFTVAEATLRQHEEAEWELSLMYGADWHWAAGALLTDDKIGLGARFRF